MDHKQQIDLADFLGGVEPYAALDEAALMRLAGAARIVRLGRGGILFKPGDACRGVHVVVAGRVKLSFCSAQGAEKVIGIAGAGEGIGDDCIPAGRDHQLHAEALGEATLAFLPREAVLECVDGAGGFAWRLMQRIADRVHRLLLDVEAASLLSGSERIADYLVREVDAVAQAGGGAEVELSVPKAIVASRLDLTQEHFSRLLRQLSEQGMIAVDGRRIRIHDVARLRRFRDSGDARCVARPPVRLPARGALAAA